MHIYIRLYAYWADVYYVYILVHIYLSYTVDSVWLHVCSVLDHRWPQNVVKTKKWHTRCSWVCHWCSYHILTSSVIHYCSGSQQNGIYLFCIIMKQIITPKAFVYFKILKHKVKAGLCPLWQWQKKPFDIIYYLYKMKQFHWLLYVAKNCDWLRKITPLSNLTQVLPLVEWKLTAKAELNCEI